MIQSINQQSEHITRQHQFTSKSENYQAGGYVTTNAPSKQTNPSQQKTSISKPVKNILKVNVPQV